MDTNKQNKPATGAKPAKKAAVRLPSKPLSFSNQPTAKNGKQSKASINSGKKGGVNLMRKLSGM